MIDTQLYDELEDKEMSARFFSRENHSLFPEPYVKFRPSGTCLRKTYAATYHAIRDMEVREDDIWVISVPKSGTTWTQEMVWLLNEDLDFDRAKTCLTDRFPYLESHSQPEIYKTDPRLKFYSLDVLLNRSPPRYFKTHLHLDLLPKEMLTKKPKIIYVARRPHDQCVSMYHHRVLFGGFKGTMDEFVEEYVEDFCYWLTSSPLMFASKLLDHCAPYWPHVRTFWNLRDEPNVLFLKYEDMKKDLGSVVRKTADFLGKTLSDQDLATLLNHLSFESMKNNPAVNNDGEADALIGVHGIQLSTRFMRKGQVGSGNLELSPEACEKIDEWVAKNKVDGIWDDI